MSIARRAAAAALAASLGLIGIVAMSSPAQADTSWGYIVVKKGAIE